MSSELGLADQIRAHIRAQGPMSLSTYVRLCLTHPRDGYYINRDPLGAKGDFVTAPEISQMFGELVGAWVLTHWHVMGKPRKFDLVELGPGRGTLLADALRVIARDPEAKAALSPVLLETSPALIALQKQVLSEWQPRWITEIADLASDGKPLIVIANEFFDALPIKQFQFANGHWHERLLGLDGDKLVWGLSETPLPDEIIPAAVTNPQDGEILEINPLAQSTVRDLARVINRRGGGLIAFDYGYASTQTGDTFQAVKDHAFADPLASPGEADLTAHVDFEALINAARQEGALAHLAGTQAEVLTELGIVRRAEKLAAANPARADGIRADLDRLIGDDAMGKLFKVMVMFGATAAAPFETADNLSGNDAIRHGFFGRQGGISEGIFASLNVSYKTGDRSENATANRATAMQALGLALDQLHTVKQVHSAKVITLDGEQEAGSIEADGLVTDLPGHALGILTADCTPILFADPRAGVIGACHAGWRGAVNGVIANTVSAMQKLGADPANIIAGIGPVIFAEDYEVGPDFAQEVVARHPDAASRFFIPQGASREHFDLPGFVHDRLKEAGVPNIEQVGQSTYARPDLYFSHRYATHHGIDTGRQIAIIALC